MSAYDLSEEGKRRLAIRPPKTEAERVLRDSYNAVADERDRLVVELAAVQAERDAALKDAERLNWLELILADGSYQSIMHDLAACVQHARQAFPGPALRSFIDGEMHALAAGKGERG